MSAVPTPRLLAFLALFVFMVLLPALPHLFGVQSRVIRSWRMFHGYGNDTCAVEYFTVTGGAEAPVQRCVALGYESCGEAPSGVRLLHDREDVLSQGRAICRKLGPDTDLRARARCGSEKGWQVKATGEQNLCTLPVDKGAPKAPIQVRPPQEIP